MTDIVPLDVDPVVLVRGRPSGYWLLPREQLKRCADDALAHVLAVVVDRGPYSDVDLSSMIPRPPVDGHSVSTWGPPQ